MIQQTKRTIVLSVVLSATTAHYSFPEGGSVSSDSSTEIINSPSSPRSPRGITITNPRFLQSLEFLVAGLALLAPRETIFHLFGYEAILGGVAYSSTLRGGNPALAKKFVGHIGLATLLIVLCNKILKTPIDLAVPAGLYWVIQQRGGSKMLRETMSQFPTIFKQLATLTPNSQQLTTVVNWVMKLLGLTTTK